jgi:hypothetical protein
VALQAAAALLWAGKASARIDEMQRRLDAQAPVAERLARLETQADASAPEPGPHRSQDWSAPMPTDDLKIEGYASPVLDPRPQRRRHRRRRLRGQPGGRRAGVKMLHQHDDAEPVGVWDESSRTPRACSSEAGSCDRRPVAAWSRRWSRPAPWTACRSAFAQVKARTQGRLRVLSRVELWEVSIVTFPMLPARG